MKNKYIFPVQLFVILEKIKCRIWINKSLEFNNYYIYFSKKWFLAFIFLIKHEVLLNNSSLIDQTANDMHSSVPVEKNKWLFFFNRIQSIYNFYFYSAKTRIILFMLENKNAKLKQKTPSIDRFFQNANWLERETSEMYGLFFFFKKDARKLLLDYSKIENPMLKDFPGEGFHDVFYNFFFNQVTTIKNETVEL